jgi:acetyltransferase-like isoleucine patch superfamily enzyme
MKPFDNAMIFDAYDRILAWLKGRHAGQARLIDRRIPSGAVVAILSRRCLYALRGLIKTTVLQQRPRVMFAGPGVVLRHARFCRFGRNVTLETGVTIDALSQTGVVFGDQVSIGAYSIVRCSHLANLGEGLTMGSYCSCDAWCFFGAGGKITIGSNVMMGQHTSFHAETHLHESTDLPIRSQGVEPRPITIEDDCWIGANVTFLGGAYVGRGSIVAAGAVVRGTFPPYAVIAGVPAKIVKSRLAPKRESEEALIESRAVGD